MFRLRFALLAALPAAALVVGAACSGTDQNAGQAAAGAEAVTLHYTVVASDSDQAKSGPDGQAHDTFVTNDNTVIPLGAKVTIEVKNYDDAAHGMVFPDLGIAKEIKGGGTEDTPSITTFTFTASKAGDFRWYCPVPCDSDAGAWAMSAGNGGPDQLGFMAGLITVK